MNTCSRRSGDTGQIPEPHRSDYEAILIVFHHGESTVTEYCSAFEQVLKLSRQKACGGINEAGHLLGEEA